MQKLLREKQIPNKCVINLTFGFDYSIFSVLDKSFNW